MFILKDNDRLAVRVRAAQKVLLRFDVDYCDMADGRPDRAGRRTSAHSFYPAPRVHTSADTLYVVLEGPEDTGYERRACSELRVHNLSPVEAEVGVMTLSRGVAYGYATVKLLAGENAVFDMRSGGGVVITGSPEEAVLTLPIPKASSGHEVPASVIAAVIDQGERSVRRTLREWPHGKVLDHVVDAAEVRWYWRDLPN